MSDEFEEQTQRKVMPDEFQDRSVQGDGRGIRRSNSAPADVVMDEDQQEAAPSPPPQSAAPPPAQPKASRAAGRTAAKPSSGKKGKRAKSKEPNPILAIPMVVPQIPLPKKEDPELLKLDPSEVMAKLQSSMDKTTNTQKLLQEWDRANGLPKSHSQTMVNSSRSRKQLTEGVILKKWNGAPLLNFAKDGEEATKSQLNSTLP